ncbi:MAG: 50S ribosomal protein L25 [Planctomycetes bacterium]|nr:50S ribosomal protein L25 [Planctomycetota bacterium]
MADTVSLKAEIREGLGSKCAAKLRKGGKLPAVMYGHGKEALSIALDGHTFVEELHHGHRLFEIDAGGNKQMALVKALQYDHFGKNMIHVDLMRVDMSEHVTVKVKIELRGTHIGAQSGGMIDSHLDELEVECAVSDIPDVIQVVIKDIDVGDAIHAGEIELPAGMTLKTPSDALVLACHVVAAAKSTEELEEEQAVAPEVITEKAEEGEAGPEGA